MLLLEPSSSTSPSPLLDQEGGDIVRTVGVLNVEVLSIQHLVIGDLNHDEYDSIITVLHAIYKWYVDAISLP